MTLMLLNVVEVEMPPLQLARGKGPDNEGEWSRRG